MQAVASRGGSAGGNVKCSGVPADSGQKGDAAQCWWLHVLLQKLALCMVLCMVMCE